MNAKQQYYLVGLLGLGALAVLYFLWKQSSASPANPGQPEPVGAPEYPNASQPIELGDVNITDAPPYLTANVPLGGYDVPSVVLGSNSEGCGCDDCDPAGIPVTQQTVPQSVFDAAKANFDSYISKVTPVNSQEAFATAGTA